MKNVLCNLDFRVFKYFAGDGVVVKGRAYGVRSIRVDGNDALAVYNAVRAARKMAIQEHRPILIEVIRIHKLYLLIWIPMMSDVFCFINRLSHTELDTTRHQTIQPGIVQRRKWNGGGLQRTLSLDLGNGLKAMVGGIMRLKQSLEVA